MSFFTEVEKNTTKIYMKPQKTPKSQRNFEREEQGRRHHTS